MRKLLFFVLLFTGFQLVKAQQIFHINNCIAVSSYLAEKGDTLVIACDTIYLLNKKTYQIYETAYEKLKGRDANVRQILNTYESLVQVQGKRIEQQELEYNSMKMQFDSLAVSSGKFIDRTGNKLTELTDVLSSVDTNLKAAMIQINESQSALKNEQKKKLWNSLGWGAGGFTLGLLTCLLLK